MRDSSNLGSADYGSPVLARGSPTKRFPTLATLGEEAVSPAVIRSLSIAGRWEALDPQPTGCLRRAFTRAHVTKMCLNPRWLIVVSHGEATVTCCSPRVGQTLSVVGPDRTARDNLPLQWLREGPAEGQVSVISGAVRNQARRLSLKTHLSQALQSPDVAAAHGLRPVSRAGRR